MPELPEIETVKLQLQKVLIGQKSTKYEVLSTKVVQGDLNKIVGQKIIGVERRGKVLLIDFGNNTKLGFHFKMTGQLIYEESGKRIVGGHPTADFVNKMPGKHTRVIFDFEKGKLFFNDMRMFGWVQINPKFVDKLGPEPFEMSADKFVENIGKTRKPIKVAIMDQSLISGVGNIYANDALWEAKINPQTSSRKLQETQLRLLFKKIKLVLSEGIKYGGATSENYLNLHGLGGHYQDHFRTYNREGEPCLDCKTSLVRTVVGGRGTFYCPNCQF